MVIESRVKLIVNQWSSNTTQCKRQGQRQSQSHTPVHLYYFSYFTANRPPQLSQNPKISQNFIKSFYQTQRQRLQLPSPKMASLTSTSPGTRIPRTPSTSFPKIPSKSHQYPQSISLKQPHQKLLLTIKASNQSTTSSSSSSPGLYSAQKFELTAQNVDLVLEDVRPYLISDGGNVDVVSVQDGVVSLKLQGANITLFFNLLSLIILLVFIEYWGVFCFVIV